MIKKIKRIFYRSIENKEISYKNLKELMKNKTVYLIDVRSNQEYEEGHLDSAINIPIYNIEKKKSKNVRQKTIQLFYIVQVEAEVKKRKAY